MKDKVSFILYMDQRDVFELLSDEDAGKLIKHIFSYCGDEYPDGLSPLLQMAFVPIQKQLKRDLKNWESIKDKRSKAGKAGANARWQTQAKDGKRILPMAKMAVNENVNVNVNVNKDTKVSICFDELLEFLNTTLKRQFRTINTSVRQKYKARIKEGYTIEDIHNAITNASRDQFHKDANCKWLTPEYFSRADTLDKFGTKPKELSLRERANFKGLTG